MDEMEVLRQIDDEVRGSQPGRLGECTLREFTSRSNGRNRKPRQPRSVTLLEYAGFAYQVKEDRIIGRKSGGVAPDVVASEILGHLSHDNRSTDRLLEELRRRDCK